MVDRIPMLAGWKGTPIPEWFGSWWGFAIVVGTVCVVAWWLFRSLRRWQQLPPGTPEQIQAEMRLFAESRLTDRW